MRRSTPAIRAARCSTASGQVVGIVVGILNPTDQDFFVGIGFAVPIDCRRAAQPVRRRINRYIWNSHTDRRWSMDQNQSHENSKPMERVLYEVKKVIVGQDHLLERLVVALLARGHILVEGVPGLAKTMAIKTLAEAIGGEFKRIQFTPDLVPADLVGTRIYNQKTGEFNTSLGPVFTNLLLADEINRAPAKVQSALLEVMQERQVTIGRETFKVPDPFLVLATQNPIETEGTYALPEAQVDRFMLKVLVGYPTTTEEFVIVERMTGMLQAVQKVLTTDQLLELQKKADQVYVDPALIEYAVRLVTATRQPQGLRPEGTAALHHVRRQPARFDQPDPDRAGAGLCARAQLRPAAGCAGYGAGCDAPPPGALLRSPLGQCDQR